MDGSYDISQNLLKRCVMESSYMLDTYIISVLERSLLLHDYCRIERNWRRMPFSMKR